MGRKPRPDCFTCVWCGRLVNSRKRPPICDDCAEREQQRDKAARERTESAQESERRGRG
jgi:hypothetical protein